MSDPTQPRPDRNVQALPRICGAGEMALRIRSTDWSRTPLGPIDAWSETLVATVNLMLCSTKTFALYWGPEHTLLYNDDYRALLHEKHPAALGARGDLVWAEAWPIIGPQIDAAYNHETTTRVEEVFIPILAGDTLRDGWFTYSFHPVYENGRVAGVGNPGRDDTSVVMGRRERDHAEQELRERNTQLQTAHDTLKMAMEFAGQASYIWSETTGMVTMDSALHGPFATLGSSAPAERWLALVHEEDQQRVAEAFTAAAAGDTPYDVEYRMVSPASSDGPEGHDTPVRWILSRAKRISPPGEPVVLAGISEDITRRRQQNDAMRQAEKLAAVGRLAASIAHEINNPLESVTNLLFLASASQNIQEVHDYLDIAERELRRVSIISSQTLRFYKQSTAPTEVSCAELFSSVLSIYQGRLVNSGVTVERRKRARTSVICFDGEIRQVLNNLVGNAIDAMHPDGGRLLIRSRDSTHPRNGRRGVVLTVADTGAGMPAHVVRKIFEPFYTTKGINGTGLGLWVSMEIVERHHGALRVRSSQRRGRSGTVFSLFLPANTIPR